MRARTLLMRPGQQGPSRNLGLLVARVGFGGTLVLAHGLGKLDRLLSGASEFADPLGLGPTTSLVLVVFAELVCALALAVGLAGRVACIPLIINFSVAFFVVHGADPFARRELALLYLVASTALLFTGPGRWSIDGWLGRR